MSITKVVYYVGDQDTPYLVKVSRNLDQRKHLIFVRFRFGPFIVEFYDAKFSTFLRPFH